MAFNGTTIELFMFDLISIIDKGHKETVEEIEKQIDNSNIAQYILGKYKDLSMINSENIKTNNVTNDRIKDINDSYLYNSDYIQGNESRKFGITEESNGLLLLVAVGTMILGEQTK